MTRVRTLVGAGLLASVPFVGQPPSAFAQEGRPLTLLISTDANKFQGELDRAAADGYRLVSGDAGVEVAIFELASDGTKRSYVFANDVDRFLKERKLQPGYRLVTSTFGADQAWFGAIFERIEGDDRQRAYRFVKAGSPGAVRKKLIDEGAARGALVLAVTAGGDGVGVLLEDAENAPEIAVVATGNTGALSREISAAASKGLCIVDSDGIRGAIYVLQACPNGQSAPAYEVISTTKTGTFEKELNAAAAKAQRFVASSLIGVEKKALMSTYANEFVAVVERAANATASTYRVLAAVRLGTLGKEIETAAKEGFRLAAFTIGPKESLVVMEKR